mgnify:CR=1 FL=1
MPIWVTWMLGVVLVAGESASLAAFGLTGLCAQMGLVLGVLLGLRRDFIPGALTLAALLPVVEWFAAGPAGVYGIGLGVVFLLMQLARTRLRHDWGLMHFAAGALAAVVHPLILAGAFGFLWADGALARAVVWTVPTSVVGMVVCLWPAQWLLEKGDAAFEGAARRTMFS